MDSMLEIGVVRPSKSPYASPIVLGKKKDGSNRVCVDFWKLNKITEIDPEPMKTAEDLFCQLSGKKYLSKIDLTKGYWQIPVAPKDVYKTVFVTPDGQYEFLSDAIRDGKLRSYSCPRIEESSGGIVMSR